MELIRPCAAYLASYREAINEDRLNRPGVEPIFSDPVTIIERAHNYEQGINLPPGFVKATTLWLVDQGKFIGELSIRHELSPALLRYGGHIDYEIRRSECGKGFATKMLAMALPYCKETLKLNRVLVTCDDDNIGSIKVITKNGGVLENKVMNSLERGPVLTRRYWIDL